VNKDFLCWIGHINLEHDQRFWVRESIDGIDHLTEISMDQVLTSYIGYQDLPLGESIQVFS
jgi:hypothetical protein